MSMSSNLKNFRLEPRCLKSDSGLEVYSSQRASACRLAGGRKRNRGHWRRRCRIKIADIDTVRCQTFGTIY